MTRNDPLHPEDAQWLAEVLAVTRNGEVELLLADGRIQVIRSRTFRTHRKRRAE